MNNDTISLLDWSGRAFQLENRQVFHTWVKAPYDVGTDPGYTPPCPTVSPRLRGKSSTLSRLVMEPFFELVTDNHLDPKSVDLVFASRYGEIRILESLLDAIYTSQPLSPLDFCNSVHHTPTGYLSIAAKNQQISRTVSAGANTFGAGLVEVWQLLQTRRSKCVALLIGDESVPAFFVSDDTFAYGMALLFGLPEMAVANDPVSAIPISLQQILDTHRSSTSPFTWLRSLPPAGSEQ